MPTTATMAQFEVFAGVQPWEEQQSPSPTDDGSGPSPFELALQRTRSIGSPPTSPTSPNTLHRQLSGDPESPPPAWKRRPSTKTKSAPAPRTASELAALSSPPGSPPGSHSPPQHHQTSPPHVRRPPANLAMTARTAGPQRFPQDPTARHSHYGPTAFRGGRRPGTLSNRSSILSQAAMTSEELWTLEDEIPDLSNPSRKASERPLDTVRRMSFTEEPLNTFGFPSEVIWPTAPPESYIPPPKAKSYTNVTGAGKRRSMLKKSSSRADSIDASYATPAFVTKDGNSSAHSSTTDLSMGTPIPINKSHTSLSRPASLGYSLDLLSTLAPREGGYALAAQMAYPGTSPASSMHSEDRRSIHTAPSFRNSRGPPARSAGMRWNDSDDLIIPSSVRHSTVSTMSTVSYHEEVVIVPALDSQQSSPQLAAVQSNTPVAPSPLSQHTTADDVRARNAPGNAVPVVAAAAVTATAAAATTAAVAAAKPKSKKELKAEAKAAALETKRLAEQKAREKAEAERRAREEKAKAKADAAKKAKEDKARLKAEKDAAKRASIMPKSKPAPVAAAAAVATTAAAGITQSRPPNGTAAPPTQQRQQVPQAKPPPNTPLPVPPPQRSAAPAPPPNGNALVPPPLEANRMVQPTQAAQPTPVAVRPPNGTAAPLPVPNGVLPPLPRQANPPAAQNPSAAPIPPQKPAPSVPETVVTRAPSTVSRDGSSLRAPSSTTASASPSQRHSVLGTPTPSQQSSGKAKTGIFSSIKKRFSMASMHQTPPLKAERPASVAVKSTPPPPTPPPKSAQPSPVRPAALNVPKPVIVPPRGSSLATGPSADDSTPGTDSEIERHASLSNPSSVVVTPTTSVATNSSPSFFPVRPNPPFRDRSDSLNSSSTDPSFVTPTTESEAPDNRISKLSLTPSTEAPIPAPVSAVAH
ncbi:uncharacterized protein LOC62_01G001414 [Vanrija pseudolonga]|uniref:Uncharacterized protein n=1 Tax=Vanrija pseudolonga TaxID=143232 RepID=A0AAF0Y512_9TREE|nr:hypothetical protein LOC62_01G001414 [Vanrija pseudolonga]